MSKIKLFLLNKITIIVTFIALILLVIGSYLLFQTNIKIIEDKTLEYWSKGDERRGGLVINFAIKKNDKKKFVITKYDSLKPITTVLLTYQKVGNNDDVQFETFYLERTGINSFKVNESIISTSTAYTFDEAVEIAKKYDVYKNNPDSSKIRNSPESNLTPQEIEQAQAQEQQNLESQKQYEQKLQDNKDKGLLNFQLFLSECVTATKPKIVGPLTREVYDRCKSEYDTYLEQKGVTYDSLNP